MNIQFCGDSCVSYIYIYIYNFHEFDQMPNFECVFKMHIFSAKKNAHFKSVIFAFVLFFLKMQNF